MRSFTLYHIELMKADLNRWNFNIEFFPDCQQFNFHFQRNTVMHQKKLRVGYLTLATGRVWLISH